MKTWWSLWGGHVFTVAAVALVFVCMYFVYRVASENHPDLMWWWFGAAALSFLLALALGMIASYLWNNWHERRYIRNEADFARSVLGGMKSSGDPATRYRRTTAGDGRTAPEREGNE